MSISESDAREQMDRLDRITDADVRLADSCSDARDLAGRVTRVAAPLIDFADTNPRDAARMGADEVVREAMFTINSILGSLGCVTDREARKLRERGDLVSRQVLDGRGRDARQGMEGWVHRINTSATIGQTGTGLPEDAIMFDVPAGAEYAGHDIREITINPELERLFVIYEDPQAPEGWEQLIFAPIEHRGGRDVTVFSDSAPPGIMSPSRAMEGDSPGARASAALYDLFRDIGIEVRQRPSNSPGNPHNPGDRCARATAVALETVMNECGDEAGHMEEIVDGVFVHVPKDQERPLEALEAAIREVVDTEDNPDNWRENANDRAY